MRYLSISEVLELHDRIISSSGGSHGIRDLNALESAVNQPRHTFDQKDFTLISLRKQLLYVFPWL
jgi:death-on-curing protein